MSWVQSFVDDLCGRYLECVCGRVVVVKQGEKRNLNGTRHRHARRGS
jgi:hypothetical protein